MRKQTCVQGAAARTLWHNAGTVHGTLGAAYLQSNCLHHIDHQTIRWHHNLQCLVFAIVDLADKFVGVILSPIGSAQSGDTPTQVPGSVHFAGSGGVLCIAQSITAALAINACTGYQTWASVAPISAIDALPDAAMTIVVCPADTPKNAPDRIRLRNRINQWRREGRTVVIATPWLLSRLDYSDLHDTLRQSGAKAVREQIQQALAPSASAPHGRSIADARVLTTSIIQNAIDKLLEPSRQPLIAAIRVGVGIGKTHTALNSIPGIINRTGGPVALAVPTHKLGEDILDRIGHLGLRVMVWRGREAINPATGLTMCNNLDAVRDAQRVGGSAQLLACDNRLEGRQRRQCLFFQSCPYQKQRQAEADLWIIPHALLFEDKPSSMPVFRLLIIDEDMAGAGIRGIDPRSPVVVTADEIARAPLAPFSNRQPSSEHSPESQPIPELAGLRKKLLLLLQTRPNGYLDRAAAIKVGITFDECERAASLEWKRWRQPPIHAVVTAAARQKTLAGFKHQMDVPRLSRTWLLLADLLKPDGPPVSGNLAVCERTDRQTGAAYRTLRLQWRRDIRKSWHLPTLLMSATLRLDLLRPYFPDVFIAGAVVADAPNQHVTYWHGKSFSHSNLNGRSNQEPDKAAMSLRKMVWAKTLVIARENSGKTLLIVPKAVEDWIRNTCYVPDTIDITHHGQVAGRDQWGDVRTVIIVGRNAASPDTVERQASALTGALTGPKTNSDGWFTSRTITYSDRQGVLVSIERDDAGHMAEQVRASITEDGIEQAIGRGRGVARTSATPLSIHLFGTGIPDGLPIDVFNEWRPFSPEEEAVAIHGIWLENAEDMATVVGTTANALRVQRHRLKKDRARVVLTFPYEYLLQGYVTVLYQKPRTGKRFWKAFITPDSSAAKNPTAWIASRMYI